MNEVMPPVTLVLLGDPTTNIQWTLGKCAVVAPVAAPLADCLRDVVNDSTDTAILIWDCSYGQPNEESVTRLLAQTNIDVWHSGLSLGLQNHPKFLDYVSPTWSLNCDADPSIESSSWRLSLRACLVRTSVLKHLGGPDPMFQTLEAAGLDMGFRYMLSGAHIRHTPALIEPHVESKISIPIDDQIRYVYNRYSLKWVYWSLFRAGLTAEVNPVALWNAYRRVSSTTPKSDQSVFAPNQIDLNTVELQHDRYRVTVLIATLDRYPYLRKLLNQLRAQTIAPLEIIIVDQTEVDDNRDYSLQNDFSDLPLKIIYLDEQGQCLSRNTGLQSAEGEYVLFLDDDDEIGANLIELHLKNLEHFCADTSSGSVDEVGALPLAGSSLRTRISDVFPTNNTLIRKNVLYRSGLFDMAFQRRQSEDGDLGIRIHLTGALMIYNPQISVFHHRAPRGGLRVHGARVITYSSSRRKLLHRRLPHVSEMYIRYRYFTSRQRREADVLTILGTFSIRGNLGRRLLKIFAALLMLPDTILKLRHKHQAAKAMLGNFPQIPRLDS